jgi:N6-L-threonylcarbamoyladenine synthase
MLDSGNLDFSFSGLKTAVLALIRAGIEDPQVRADIAHAVEDAITDVLVAKSRRALASTSLNRLVVAGGVSANRILRARLDESARKQGFDVFYPELELCTDNGAMIAYAGAFRTAARDTGNRGFEIRPRWNLAELARPDHDAAAPR